MWLKEKNMYIAQDKHKIRDTFLIYKNITKFHLDFSSENKSYEKRLLCAPDMTNCCSIKW